VPAGGELLLRRERLLRRLAAGRRDSLPFVHRAPAEERPDPRALDSTGRPVDVLAARIGDRRDAVPDLLESARERARLDVLLGERRLVRPDPVVKPGEEVDVVGEAAPQLLAQMAVSVDEAGYDEEFARVHGLGRFALPCPGSDADDPVAFDLHAAALDDRAGGVHRHDQPAGDPDHSA
jgi:hypothetical protein